MINHYQQLSTIINPLVTVNRCHEPTYFSYWKTVSLWQCAAMDKSRCHMDCSCWLVDSRSTSGQNWVPWLAPGNQKVPQSWEMIKSNTKHFQNSSMRRVSQHEASHTSPIPAATPALLMKLPSSSWTSSATTNALGTAVGEHLSRRAG